MTRRKAGIAALGAAVLIATLAATPAAAAPGSNGNGGPGGGNGHRTAHADDTLAANDGWASQNGGTTGGSHGQVYDIRSWDDFRAHASGNAPRILVLHGAIDAFDTDGHGRRGAPRCSDIERQVAVALPGGVPFTMRGFINHAARDPQTPPSGPWEQARQEAARLQTAQVRVAFGSNITIIGDDRGSATITGAHLLVNRASNVILRNFTASDAYDCFPEWDPLDGSAGNWNALYDNISVMNDSENVWVDHVRLNDGENGPHTLPTELGRKFEVHDGLLDITHGSSYVTVSDSILEEHDKTSLVGSADNRPADEGRLKITWRTNLFRDLGQRAPRVRYGDVDVVNNHYEVTDRSLFQYSIGVGAHSSVIAEANAFTLASGIASSQLLRRFNGTQLRSIDNTVNGAPVNLVAAYNSAATAANQLTDSSRWTDPHRLFTLDADDVPLYVQVNAGPGRLN